MRGVGGGGSVFMGVNITTCIAVYDMWLQTLAIWSHFSNVSCFPLSFCAVCHFSPPLPLFVKDFCDWFSYVLLPDPHAHMFAILKLLRQWPGMPNTHSFKPHLLTAQQIS